jgi:hypothetical protein
MAWEVRGVPTGLIKEMSSRTSGGRATSVSAGQLVAIWEEGQVLLFAIFRSGGTAEAYEPSWQALRYVGSIDSGTADPG